MQPRIPMFLSSVAVGIVIAVGALSLIGSEAKARMRPVTASGNSAGAVMSVTAPTNSELTVAYYQLLTNPSQDAKKRPGIVHEIRAMLKRGAIRSGQKPIGSNIVRVRMQGHARVQIQSISHQSRERMKHT